VEIFSHWLQVSRKTYKVKKPSRTAVDREVSVNK